MKIKLFIAAILMHSLSCISQDKNETDALSRFSYSIFYWEKSTEDEFYALRFDSTAKCQLFSFGKNLPNSRQVFSISFDRKAYVLQNVNSKEKFGRLEIFSDSLIVLSFLPKSNLTYRLILDKNSNFERLFNYLQFKHAFECIRSTEISYQGIILELTSATPYLADTTFTPKVETLVDEIYGTETYHYLEHNGNRFYYAPTGRRLFSKIEIVTSSIQNPFLGISIGDTFAEVREKLDARLPVYIVGASELRAKVCNSRFKGRFGTLLFKFKKSDNSQAQPTLQEIFYDALDETE